MWSGKGGTYLHLKKNTCIPSLAVLADSIFYVFWNVIPRPTSPFYLTLFNSSVSLPRVRLRSKNSAAGGRQWPCKQASTVSSVFTQHAGSFLWWGTTVGNSNFQKGWILETPETINSGFSACRLSTHLLTHFFYFLVKKGLVSQQEWIICYMWSTVLPRNSNSVCVRVRQREIYYISINNTNYSVLFFRTSMSLISSISINNQKFSFQT